MLRSLSIRNYALINQLEINFDKGLSIITGETGAGKSILLGALGLVLGQRADSGTLKKQDQKCVVEASFDIKKYHLHDFFESQMPDVEYEDLTILRRIISPSGKSRAFVNDIPVNLTVLKDLSLRLIDVHSQHESLMLSDIAFQLTVVDAFAANQNLLEKYRQQFKKFKKITEQYNELRQKATQAKADSDFFEHQHNELQKAALHQDEQQDLENELKTLNHAEEIKINLANAESILTQETQGILSALKEVQTSLEKVQEFLKQGKSFVQRTQSTYIELNDIASELEILANDVEYSPERADFVGQRLDTIYSLQQKHRVETVAELLKIQKNLEKKLAEIGDYDFAIQELAQQQKQAQEELHKLATRLSENRKKAIPKIEKAITQLLKQLGMPSAIFRITQNTQKDYTLNGMDKISFLFSANRQIEPDELTKVASGGEMSRVMLSIKSLIARSISLPTIIFDEIDTGVSGDIADKMGEIIKQMAGYMQVINITHLPQIAAKGDTHFLVYKSHEKGATATQIKKLSPDERLTETAKMLSGSQLTSAAIENARQLLGK